MVKINPGQLFVYLSCLLYLLSVLFAIIIGRIDVGFLSLGVGLICYGMKIPIPLIVVVVSIASFLGAYLPFGELQGVIIQGFEDRTSLDEGFKNQDDEEESDDKEMFKDEVKEEVKEVAKPKKIKKKKVDIEEDEDVEDEGFKSNPPPDNGSRAEKFVLGKKYKMPKESDDKEYHLDAGTTFMNAYKSLKPDEISAMTNDTKELINTQKQLMNTLSTLKPLITDGKQMMDTFQNYFGSGDMGLGSLSKIADKFGGK